MKHSPPSILCLSGFDPSGGAGIQADIESCASMGAHAVPVITALTIQNTHNIQSFQTVDVNFFKEQVKQLLDDVAIKAIKIGMIGSLETVKAIEEILNKNTTLPVIYDPVLAAGGGTELTSLDMINAIKDSILPFTTVLTPNSIEARRLTDEEDLKKCGTALMHLGCEAVLLTGAHEEKKYVENLWFNQGKYVETFSWERLPHEYHGSGCTLASAIAALIAQGLDAFNAVNEAQDYSWNALDNAFAISDTGQRIPHRFYWQHDAE